MSRTPQVLVNIKVQNKRALKELPSVLKAIAAAEKKLGTEGRVLVRYSGTESKARVMVEGPGDSVIRPLAQDIADELARACGR